MTPRDEYCYYLCLSDRETEAGMLHNLTRISTKPVDGGARSGIQVRLTPKLVLLSAALHRSFSAREFMSHRGVSSFSSIQP